MKRKILTMLRQAEDYVSGQQICTECVVSRTAVWKVIRTLKDEGYGIDAVQNRGYRLVSSPDILTEAEIGSRRRDRWKDCPLKVFSVTDSTNTQAAQMAEQGAPEGTLVAADSQRSGKGRRGRQWETPAGVSLAMSFVLKPSYPPGKASMLTLIAALAGKRALNRLAGVEPQIKWPNDIVLNRKKVCGILTEMEMTLESDSIRQIIVGMGFNVRQNGFNPELADKATSLFLETGKEFSRAELACLVMEEFADAYQIFEEKLDLSFLKDEYNACLAGRDQEVRILSAGEEWTGRSLGINDQGELLVKDAGGKIHEILGGEVSVRGLYGYV